MRVVLRKQHTTNEIGARIAPLAPGPWERQSTVLTARGASGISGEAMNADPGAQEKYRKMIRKGERLSLVGWVGIFASVVILMAILYVFSVVLSERNFTLIGIAVTTPFGACYIVGEWMISLGRERLGEQIRFSTLLRPIEVTLERRPQVVAVVIFAFLVSVGSLITILLLQ